LLDIINKNNNTNEAYLKKSIGPNKDPRTENNTAQTVYKKAEIIKQVTEISNHLLEITGISIESLVLKKR
jgi:hypothetical protein